MGLLRSHRIALAAALTLAATAGARVASADIYIYTDAQGRTNVTNVPPPEGARVTKVVPDTPPNAFNDAAREATQRAEVASLAQRVDQLQGELVAAKQATAPVVPQVIVVQAPAPAPVYYDYAPEPAPVAPAVDCVWNTCDAWWSGAFGYPFASFVYVPAYGPMYGGRGGRHGGPGGGGGHRPPPARPGPPGPGGSPVIPSPHPLVKVAALAPR